MPGVAAMGFRTSHAVVLLSSFFSAGIVTAADGPAPLRFEPNRGQADARWEYVARTAAGEVVLGAAEARIGAAALAFPGASEGGAWEPVERLPGEASYLLGDDPSRWILGVPAFGAVVRRNVYPGIDVTLRGAGRRVDLEVQGAAGTDTSAIAIELDGKKLALDLPRGVLREAARIEVPIELPGTALPPERPRLAMDAEANLYVAGRVTGQAATAYVTMLEPSGKDVLRTTYLDGLDEASPLSLAVSPSGEIAIAGASLGDAVVVRIDPSGRGIVRRTTLGGGGADAASAIAFAKDGSLWVVGATASVDLPVSHDAFQPIPGGATDAFVVRIDGRGELRFASYLGGAEADEARGVAVDREGDVYVAGMRGPVASVTRLDAKGGLVYARTLPGDATAVAITRSGHPVIAGTFVARLDASGAATFTTELSGRADALALDGGDVAWVAGTRGSDAFVEQISLSKRTTLHEKTLRGDRDDVPGGVLVDGNGDGFVAGYTTSTELPDAEQPESTRGAGVFVAKVEGVEPAPLGSCPGSRNFDGNVSNAWEVKENWSGDTLPVAGDSVCISGFNVVMGGSSSVGSVRLEGGSLTINSGVILTVAAASEFTGSLTINNGTLTGAGNRTTSGSFTFTAGTLSGAGITTSTGPVSLSGAGAKGLFAHRWDTNTTVTWTGTGAFGLSSAAVVNNAGTWDAQSDATLSWPVGTATAFNNSGTFKKSAGTGTTTLAAPFYNTGSVLVQTGTLNSTAGGSGSTSWDLAAGTTLGFGGGTYHLTAGTTLTGAGRVLLSGAELDVETAVSMPASMNFEMSGGILGAAGTLTAAGPVLFTGGTMQDAGVLTCNGTFTVSGAANKGVQFSRVINTNAGTVFTGTGGLILSTLATINNAGTWDCQSDATLGWGVGTAPAFNNNGTFKKSAGAGTSPVTLPFNNAGSVLVQSGTIALNGGGTSTAGFDVAASTTLQFNGSTYNWNAGTTFAGNGRVLLSSTTLGVNADVTIPATMSFDMAGGVLTGSATLTTAGPLNWTAGTMQSTGITTCNGALNISGAGVKGMQLQRVLNNNATATQSGANLGMSTLAVINNPGTWDLAGDTSIVWGVGTAPAFNNTGTVKKSAGTGTSFMQLPFNNDGVVLVQTGTLNSNSGGTSTGSFHLSGTTFQLGGGTFGFNAGTTFTGIGNVLLSAATLNVNDAVATPATIVFDMTGGTMQAAGTFTAEGIFNYTGGSFGSVGITNFNGALNISGAAAKGISSRTLNTNAVTTWSGAGTNIGVSFAGIINNTGTWEVLNDASIAWGVGGAPVFKNLGTFRKSVGVGTTSLQLPYQNQGTVEIQSGAIHATSSYTQTAGTTKLTGGSLSGTVTIAVQGGTLAGTGTVTAPVVVSGTGALSPGLSAGTLNVTGTYTQQAPSGALSVEIGGTAPGTQHDRANVTGATTLAGVLNVSLINGFVPLPGDTFTILTYPSRTGTFATVNFPSAGCIGWRLTYGATALVLTAAAVPEEIAGLAMTSKTAFSWAAAPTYANTSYNVLRGDLDKLPVGPGADETCVVPATNLTTGSDAGTPVLGKGFWYLVRETVTGCGVGTYGFRTAGTERISTACP